MPTAEWSVGHLPGFPGDRGWEEIAESQPAPHSLQGLIQKASTGQSSTVCLGFSSCQHSSPRMREILPPAQSVVFSHKTMDSYGVMNAGFTKCHLHETQQ